MNRYVHFLLIFWGLHQGVRGQNAVLTNDTYGLDLRKYATVWFSDTNITKGHDTFLEFNELGRRPGSLPSDSIVLFIPLKNASDNTEWLVGLGDAQAEVHYSVFSEGEIVQKGLAGLMLPLAKRSVEITKGEYILLHLETGKSYVLKLNFIFNEPVARQMWSYCMESLKIYKQQQLMYEYGQERTWDALAYGAVIIMLLYNTFLALTLRAKEYAWYSLFIFTFLLYNLGADGLLQNLIFSENPLLERKIRFFIGAIMMMCYIQFAKYFLRTKQYVKNINKVLNYSHWLFVLGAAFLLFGQWYTGRAIILISLVFVGLYIIYASLVVTRKNYTSAYYFLMANTILIAGGIASVLYMLSIIPHNVTTKFIEHIPQYASIFELTLFSLGLAARIKDAQRDMFNQRIQLELEKKEIIDQKNRELENKVEERTFELLEQKKQIQQLNTQLEEKVRERTKKLQKAYRDLLNLNYELDSFIYRAAHDIRGPISTIMGLCNIALMEKDFQKCQEYLAILDKYSKATQVTLNRILSVNDIKNNHIKLSAFTWNELENEVMALLIANPDRDKVKISFEGDLARPIYSDRHLMQLIFVNLIDNAIRFRRMDSNTNPECTITVHALEKGFQILVKDNGEGIDDSIKDRIFDMFFRGSEYASGSGLGLYICKLAVKKLNGEIELAYSTRGETVFELRLPYFKEKTGYALAMKQLDVSQN